MPDHPSPAVRLNNFLQKRKELASISWIFEDSGPQNHKTWTATCKYNGKVIGVGTSPNKVPAKDEAATQALKYLQDQQDDDQEDQE